MKYHHNNKGNVILYIIAIMIIMAGLGTGVFYVTLTSSFSALGVSAQNKARYLAEAGIRYSLTNLQTLQNTTSPLPEYKLNSSAGDKFILEISGIGGGGNINIKSTGVSNPGTPYEASHKIALDITPSQYQPLTSAPFSFAGTGSGGMAAMAAPAEGVSGKSGVTVDTVNKQINLGSGASGTAGCVWYQGWADRNGSDCINGNCNFNKGIRAYFDFQYNTPWDGDGFTFAIISAHNNGTTASPVYVNNVTDCGGGSYGEYMGYAGTGVTGNGLQPPKIAIEFDPFLNLNPTPPLDNSDVCSSNSRNDNTFSGSKHSTSVYWGNNSTNNCSGTTSNTYDDNRHGNGGTNDPKNPDGSDMNPDGTTYPYMIQDFDSFGTVIASPVGRRLSFRLEIDRVDDTTSLDYRKYKMRVWLKPYAVYTDSNGLTYAVYKDSNSVTFDDTSKKFNHNNDYPPDFQQTITLTQTWHDIFDRILFGWTQATDSTNAQTVIIRNFTIDFKNQNDF